MSPKSEESIRNLIRLLVRGDYDRIEKLTKSQRLKASEIADAVSGYPGTLVEPERLDLDIVEVANQPVPSFSVRTRLWTKEEGESDLSLEVTIEEHPDGPIIELDGILVF
jgi:hypothetical protein